MRFTNVFSRVAIMIAVASAVVSSFMKRNNTIKVEAYEPGSSVILTSTFGGALSYNNGNEPVDITTISSVVITNKAEKLRNGEELKVISVNHESWQDNGDNIVPDLYPANAYIYPKIDENNQVVADRFDCVVYSDVETIYANPKSSGMFEGFTVLEVIEFDNFNTEKVAHLSYMFKDCPSLLEVDLSGFDMRNVEMMDSLFSGCTSLKNVIFEKEGVPSKFNTEKCHSMNGVFVNCTSLESIKFPSTFVTNNVTDMGGMFTGCTNLVSVDLSRFDTGKVTNMAGMFQNCESLTSLDFPSTFVTTNVKMANAMFYDCVSLQMLDLSNFDFSNIEGDNPLFEQMGAGKNGFGLMFGNSEGKHFSLQYIFTPNAIKEGVSLDLPNSYTEKGDLATIDSSMTNMLIIPGSKAFNLLLNIIASINPCSDYEMAPEMLNLYNSISDEEKAFLEANDIEENTSFYDRYIYTINYYEYKNPTEKSNVHMITSINNSSSFLVVAIAMSSLAILGYYLMQKRKYAR